jgi:heptosyltransferase-2
MPDRYLVRAPNWVGDAVMSLPFFASLRHNAGSDAIVTCLCRSALAPLFRDVPEISDVIELDESAGRSGWRFVRRNARHLRAHQFDTAFCLPTSLGSAMMLRLARIPHRLGHSAEGRRLLLTRSLPYGRNGRRPHRAEGFLNLLSLCWPDPSLIRDLRFSPDDSARARVDVLLRNFKDVARSRVLAVALGAAQPNKMWMIPHFAAITARWIDEFHGRVFLVGSGADRARCDEVTGLAARDNVHNLAGEGDLSFAAEIIRRADLFLGNDSGLVHLAAAVGTPCVVISGPGDPTEVAPFSPLAVTVRHPVFCSPCYRNYCWRKDKPLECLTRIGIEDVWRHITLSAETATQQP